MYKIYKVGRQMIDKDLNIINVINRLRFFQNSVVNIMDEHKMWKAWHSKNNVIHIDDESIDSISSGCNDLKHLIRCLNSNHPENDKGKDTDRHLLINDNSIDA